MHYGANSNLRRVYHAKKTDRNSWLVLYIKISFKGFKVVFFIEK
ncbi:hypothetical protein HPSA20_1607 [Helicobacter pylori SouthAfrica20]|uniref:Uncharacterized protein n=1 Tax=Helicobacter pylori SouthAfrica20 TaxID=1352356 RepID=T1UBV8_HELPX|nr:hypothetical protein HPSA20_1607 [Helicobacter pylori SouthAfrica20]